jgi:arylsulfatase A-like enzyme
MARPAVYNDDQSRQMADRARVTVCLVLTGLCLCAPALKASPNFLFIFADDHAVQAVSAYNPGLIQTPRLDRIAREGVRFDRCLVPNSICGPSRASVLTGKYSHQHGFYDNTRSVFDGTQATFPKLLQKAGYHTALIGKWHLESKPTGFDHWEVLPGQGDYYNPVLLREQGARRHVGYVTDIITDLSLDWLNQRDPQRPFLLMVHHKAPHREWLPALRHLGHDGDRSYPEPTTLRAGARGLGDGAQAARMNLAMDLTPLDLKLEANPTLDSNQRAVWDAYYQPRNAALTNAALNGEQLLRWKYNRYLHDYLGCIKSVDESVGRLLDYLDVTGLATNTLVVYCSDQGFFLGEHGWFDKRWIYEPSLRAPLLIRWPGVVRPGRVNRDLVSHIDFAPTFLQAAGVPVPEDVAGRSLLPLLRGRTPRDWRKSFYYHYYDHPSVHDVPRHYGVVTERYKLACFYDPEPAYWELLDRQHDPDETRNLWGDPRHARAQGKLETELSRLREQLRVPKVDPVESRVRSDARETNRHRPEQEP